MSTWNNIQRASTFVVAFFCVLACTKYDDTALWKKVNELDSRVSVLESSLREMNTDIRLMKNLLDSKMSGLTITSVIKIDNGFKVLFSDGSEYVIENGKDGDTPVIGNNGNWWIGGRDTGYPARGADGSTPYIGSNGNWWIDGKDSGVSALGGNSDSLAIIGVKEENGKYYWTQTINGVTSWLTDDQGRKIPVNGTDGITPLIRVSTDGYWIVSYDNGVNFYYILDGNGNKVKAGCNCESFFQSVTFENSYLIFVLIDGTKIVIEVNRDDRIDNVVPEELQDVISDYMPLYTGVNPPDIQGTYLMSPSETVYCQDGTYSVGQVIIDYVLDFSNQNKNNNKIDFRQYGKIESQLDYAEGPGAFISGDEHFFTAYFNTLGTNDGVDNKTALVISGEKTSAGIKNLFYAFVMVEKGSDPDHKLMDEGSFRIFKDGDGLSTPTTWDFDDIIPDKAVDLALPSGTLWADRNLGAILISDYGNFYSWGETAIKSTYTWSSYAWCSGSDTTLTKYNTLSSNGKVDNVLTLTREDDAANVAWGGFWHIPTVYDMLELCNTDNCTWTWSAVSGSEGYVVKSVRNGNSIFLPVAGAKHGSSHEESSISGYYWTSSLCSEAPASAWMMYFDSATVYTDYVMKRYLGLPIRPVYKQ